MKVPVPENAKSSKLSFRKEVPPKVAVSATTKRLLSLLDESTNGSTAKRKKQRALPTAEPTATGNLRNNAASLPTVSRSFAGPSIPKNVLNMPTLSSLTDQSVRRRKCADTSSKKVSSKQIQRKPSATGTSFFSDAANSFSRSSDRESSLSSTKSMKEIPPSLPHSRPRFSYVSGRNTASSLSDGRNEKGEANALETGRHSSLGLLGLHAGKAKSSRIVERHVAPQAFTFSSTATAVSVSETEAPADDSVLSASAATLTASSSFEDLPFSKLPADSLTRPMLTECGVASNDYPKSRLAALLDIPAPSDPERSLLASNAHTLGTKTKKPSNGNFVRQNLKNANGSCRGRRTFQRPTKTHVSDPEEGVDEKKIESSQPASSQDTFFSTVDLMDPVDQFLDAVDDAKLPSTRCAATANPIPYCRIHSRPCKLCTVKKTSNKGRQFWVCSLPRGEQCQHFQWADDTVQAAQEVLMRNKTTSGFIARQVSSYMHRLAAFTVPELHDWMIRHGISMVKGAKKQQLKTRVAVWVRDQVAQGVLESSDLDDIDSASSQNCDLSASTNPLAICESTGSDTVCTSTSNSSSEDELEFVGVQANRELVVNSCPQPLSGELPNQLCPVRGALFSFFGYNSFREGQEWAIRRCLDNKRTLLVAPTGFGKSLCYAIPATLKDGTCVVVSPLLSLIQDQLRMLPPQLAAATLSGSLSTAAMTATLDDIIRGRIKVLYVSPERLSSPSFRRLFQLTWDSETKSHKRKFPKVSLLCVDEAHCLSQWAHNFRPSYLRLRAALEIMQPEAVLAITATAGPRVIQNICNLIGRDQKRHNGAECDADCGTLVLKTNRDNIDVSSFVFESQEQRIAALLDLLVPCDEKTKPTNGRVPKGCLAIGSVIVYVWRQRDAEVVAENIKASIVKGSVVVYHGGMNSSEREKAQSMFIRGKARICVATVAFGLGINKSDVRGVIHMSLASSAEHYLQEIGRAGRDGAPSKAVALILADEVLVRHSLAHSDLICLSQTRMVLQFIRKVLKGAISLLAPHEGTKIEVIRLGLPLLTMARGCDCKIETIETLLSLLELNYQEQPMISVDGICYDRVTIAPKRRSLDDLAKREPLARAIMTCGTCVEAPAGESIPAHSVESSRLQRNVVGYSFGAFEFSVSACATCLGPAAESRHVFAVLRRLEESGEIALSLDTSAHGKSLVLKVTRVGLTILCDTDEAMLEKLSTELHHELHSTIDASARKSLQLHSILMDISEVFQHNSVEHDGKSASLIRFQESMQNYFAKEEGNVECCREVEKSVPFDRVPSVLDLSNCVTSLLSFLTAAEASLRLEDPCMRMSDPSSGDYKALVITKVLHGHSVSRLSYSVLLSNPLFGRFQGTKFSDLLQAVKAAV